MKSGNFEFEDTNLPGVTIIKPAVFSDDRGFFLSSYNRESFKNAGITADYVQDNHSRSRQIGTIRGFHQQLPHRQGKLVRAIVGKIDDFAIEVYPPESPTYGQVVKVRLSSENNTQLNISEDCVYRGEPIVHVHGFQVITPAEVVYKATDYYSKSDEIGLNPFTQEVDVGFTIPVDKNQMLADGQIKPQDLHWPDLSVLTRQIGERIPRIRTISLP